MAMNKRQKAILNAVEPGKAYAFDDAIKILKTATKAKFVESVDVAVRLGVDAKKSDQQVRGSTVLPAGTGKTVRVAVFVPRVPRPKKPWPPVPTSSAWTTSPRRCSVAT
jgi:large subunit ribosomal protein L1